MASDFSAKQLKSAVGMHEQIICKRESLQGNSLSVWSARNECPQIACTPVHREYPEAFDTPSESDLSQLFHALHDLELPFYHEVEARRV